MSDRDLRSLERRARTGDADAAAELLVGRFRGGRLSEERLRLAAHLGDPAAGSAARALLDVAPRRQNLAAWIRTIGHPHLQTWPRELAGWRDLVQPVCARAALAAAELAYPVWTAPAWREDHDDDDGDSSWLQRLLPPFRAWLADPTEAARGAIPGRGSWSGTVDCVAGELLSIALRPVAPGAILDHSRERDIARSAADVALAAQNALHAGVDRAGRKAVEARLRTAIQAATIPWVLSEEA